MTKESEFTIYVVWPEGEEGRAEELFDWVTDEVGKKLCGDPHPKGDCPVTWTAGGTLAREAGDMSYLKHHARCDLEDLNEAYPGDAKITQAMKLMQEVDEERKNAKVVKLIASE